MFEPYPHYYVHNKVSLNLQGIVYIIRTDIQQNSLIHIHSRMFSQQQATASKTCTESKGFCN